MSALPKAVQKQIAEANRLAEQLNQDRLNGITPQPPDGGPGPDAGAQPAAASPDAGQPPADGGQPAGSASAQPAAEGWEQKYKVLQGKYNAEVPRLQRQVNEQNSTIEQLKQQMTATQGMLAAFAQNRVAAPGQGQGPAPAAPTKLVKDEEVKEFGEDLTDFIRRVAQDSVLPAVEKRLQPVQQQVEKATSDAANTAQEQTRLAHERLLATLDGEFAEWRQLNRDPQFLEWLAQPDPYSGAARQDLLSQAYERFDAPRIVAFFKGYRNEHAVVTPPAAAAAPAQGASQRTLDDFIAPGQPKAGTTGAQNGAGKRIWTEAEIKRFYDDCRAGKFRSNPDRRRELEQDIFAAGREGRVR
jgi:hypothetical protein